MWRIVIVFMLMVLCVHTAAALDGSGTQQDPWRIESLADFDEFAADPNYWSGFTRLETDVNLAGRTYITAVIAPDVNNARWGFQGTSLTGVFDGNDHKITNLTIDGAGTGNSFVGLFGCIGVDGQVSNLGIEGVSASGYVSVGGLCGSNEYGTISTCYAAGSVSGESYLGVLCGGNVGTLTDCYSMGNVSGGIYSDSLGGLCGVNSGTISACYATSSVTSGYNSQFLGGLCGVNDGTISACYATGSVTGSDFLGGLCGFNGNGGTLSDSYATGSVTGVYNSQYLGGLCGYNEFYPWLGGMISACYATGTVTGGDNSQYLGGLCGYNIFGTISACYAIGSVIGGLDVGGLCGFNEGTLSDCYATGSVNGNDYVGGLVGDSDYEIVTACFWDVNTSGWTTSAGGEPKTTSEMKTKSTFTEAGWDFVEIWGIGEKQTYPFLRFAPAGDFNYDKKVDFFDLAILASHWLEDGK